MSVALIAVFALVVLALIRLGTPARISLPESGPTRSLWWPTQAGESRLPGFTRTAEASGRGSVTETAPPLQSLTAVAERAEFTPAAPDSSGTQSPDPGRDNRSITGLPADPLACLPPDAAGEAEDDIVLVRWVQDGASIVIDRSGTAQTVRLIGIDAPPSARRALESLLNQNPIRLLRDGQDFDSHGRLRRYVLTLDDRLINYELLLRGEVRLDAASEAYDCRETFAAAEQYARSERFGIWGLQAALAPPSDTPRPTAVVVMPTPTAGSTPTVTAAPGPTGTPPPGATLTAGVPTPTSTHDLPGPGFTPEPTNTFTPTPTVQSSSWNQGPMIITTIFFRGTVSKNESDEYIEIMNEGTTEMALGGWSLYSDSSFAELYFRSSFTLQARQRCRVYTNEIHPDSCDGRTFGLNSGAWDNEYDCGGLYNAAEESMAEYCYDTGLGEP